MSTELGMFPQDLRDCRRLFLKNYCVQARIGIYEAERLRPQRLCLNIELFIPLAASQAHADNIAGVLDYDLIRQCIDARLLRGHINLQETLCDDIACELLALPNARAVRVSSQKRDVYPDCEGVGVDIFRYASPG